MRIENFNSSSTSTMARVSAKILWEDCGRADQELFFETSSEYAESLTYNPNAFLTACINSAFREGESRVFVDGEVCPQLIDGLVDVMSWMRYWHYSPDKPIVNIEVAKRQGPTHEPKVDRAGLFLSGGIDSTATLRTNLINYPQEHPGSIKDAIVVFGLEIQEIEKFNYVVDHISKIAADAEIPLIPLHTNIRDIGPKDTHEFWGDFWVKEFDAAAFSSIAHAFSNRLSRVYFSASNDIPNYYRWGRSFFTGSHPLVDSNFSSSNMAIQLSGTSLSRFDKTKIISDWDVVLDHLRVCNLSNKYTAEFLNCGECEKCLRTMLGLHAVGALERSNAFAVKDVSNEKIRTNATLSKYTFQFYEELLGPLSEAGYHDLVKIIKNKLIKKKVVLRTIEPIKELDKKFTGGSLVRLKRLVSKKGISY